MYGTEIVRKWSEVMRRPDLGIGPCKEWQGYRTPDGYGNSGGQLTHRREWVRAHGPTTLNILHRCDNPPCGELTHLFEGTPLDNALDREAKGRGGRGERQLAHKLTQSDVYEIRDMVASGFLKKSIAARFGIAACTVSNIVAGRRWGWL